MRRFFVGMALLSMTAATPMIAWGGDREIKEQLVTTLNDYKARGELKGHKFDLKINEGVVVLTGRVRDAAQHDLVLEAARSVAGVRDVIDQLDVADGSFSMQNALANGPADAAVQPVGGTTQASDQAVNDAVVQRLLSAKQAGQLRGFGVDVNCVNGDVWLRGQVSSESQKEMLMQLVRRTPGVKNVVDDVAISGGDSNMETVMVQPVSDRSEPEAFEPAVNAARPIGAMPVPYRTAQGMPRPFAPASVVSDGEVAGAVGQPMPMAPIAGNYGTPRYDNPNLPNYAWPGYASYPNYAAVSYPQQYSPTAWPYIGPFYPYPQVPLGWRKVELEWKDGWWWLDFTSKQ
jgi:osmotically-inducible protein OsmY